MGGSGRPRIKTLGVYLHGKGINSQNTGYSPFFACHRQGRRDTPVTWKLCYTYKAIAKIEEATGLDLKKFDAWKDISSGKHFPAIVWGGLEKHNPEVTLDQVVEVLYPEAQKLLLDEIFNLMFP